MRIDRKSVWVDKDWGFYETEILLIHFLDEGQSGQYHVRWNNEYKIQINTSFNCFTKGHTVEKYGGLQAKVS